MLSWRSRHLFVSGHWSDSPIKPAVLPDICGDMVGYRLSRYSCFLLAGSFSRRLIIVTLPMKTSGDMVENSSQLASS
jgi:hypothetical protein